MIKKLDAVRLRLMKHMDRSSYNYMLLKKHFRFILMNKDDLKNENRKVWYNHRCDVIHYDQLKSDIKQINENLGHFIDLIDEYREFNKEYVGEPLDVVEQKLNSLIFKFKEKKKPDPITKKVDHQYPSEMYEIGNSLTRWKAEILNSFILVTNDNGEVMRQSNAKIESLNGKIKSNISSSMGIRNFQRLGKRIMYSINFKPEFIKYEQINLNSKAYYLNNHRKGKTYRKNNFKKDKNKK